jgi:predicted site-specific integrase-resolvase
MTQTPSLLTSAEACEQLGDIDRSTLSRWVLIGRITPAQKLPGIRGAFLFEPAEVQRLRDELRQQATA